MSRLYYIFLVIPFIFFSCEDEVAIDLNDAPPVLVVDAWVNDMPQTQEIRLMMSQPYFDSSQPPEVSGAQVRITDDRGQTFDFIEKEAGSYQWDPAADSAAFEIGRSYHLSITYEGNAFEADSELKRVPALDSVVYTFYEERNAFQPEGYYAQFYARDPEGTGDAYWIKTYKNGQYLNRPSDLNIAYDAGFSSTTTIDGVIFIEPIQNKATPLNDDEDAYEPYVYGDSVYIEIYSITTEAFSFLDAVATQIERDGGFSEIFAEPLENVPCNISCTSNEKEQVVGFFNMSAVSYKGERLEE
ncbi:DUF4249 domain-containing protein [Fulvivirga sediminis]|uniref:DUF4249 domain-containing protein n=1 Tax=Fulvivirga sediminis TaxID=2803949 RepID=A0A937K086_9BACT|nr:DUF4249 domain-containing protein [Fulvivirga sediminis]MBL3655257.1 DUF4249 domain-containing protein [Fulvivirga sediminis]